MSYRIAGIDVHKKMLAVVVADVEVEGEYQFERRLFGSNPDHLRLLANWLIEQQVEEVVMESTAQCWKPVWGALEQYWKPTGQEREGTGPMSGTLHLAQAQSNRGPRGRKKYFRFGDAAQSPHCRRRPPPRARNPSPARRGTRIRSAPSNRSCGNAPATSN